MSIKKQLNVKKLTINLLAVCLLSACGGGGSAKKIVEPIVPTAPSSGQCGGTIINDEQECITVSERPSIAYAPKDTTEYVGIAIFLHGAPGNPGKVSNLFDSTMIADKFNLVSLMPKGNGSNYEWSSNNNGITDTPDVDYLTSLINTVEARYTFSQNKVYIFGYSAGGFMAYKLACQIPERLTAIISLAGQFRGNFEHCSTFTGLAVHHLHSVSDLDVPYQGRTNGNIASVPDTIEFWQQKNGCDIGTDETAHDGVTETSSGTTTAKYRHCAASLAISKLSRVAHEDQYIAEKLLSIYDYLLVE